MAHKFRLPLHFISLLRATKLFIETLVNIQGYANKDDAITFKTKRCAGAIAYILLAETHKKNTITYI